MCHGTKSHTYSQCRWQRHLLLNVVWASNPRDLGKMKGSVTPPGFSRMHEEGESIQLVEFAMVEVGHQSTWSASNSPSGGVAIRLSLWSRHGRWSHLVSHGFSSGGGNHDNLTMGETEGAEIRTQNSASGARHHAQV